MAQYTISRDKVQAIVANAATHGHVFSEQEIEDFCTAGWPEGDEHQKWLDTASVEEIADWCIVGMHQ